jgi:hypothetical protein
MGIPSGHGHPEAVRFSDAASTWEGQLVSSNKGKQPLDAIGEDMDFEFDPLTAALRQMHESVANEPIPDDFLNLLDMIDAKMSASKKFQ